MKTKVVKPPTPAQLLDEWYREHGEGSLPESHAGEARATGRGKPRGTPTAASPERVTGVRVVIVRGRPVRI